MDPAAWRKKIGWTLKKAALRLGCSSASVVFRYERGEREAPNSIALAYERESKGEVTSEDLHRVHKRWLRAEETPKAA
jgi:transcriptional regulator with XRE-family HTH domain